MGEVHDWDGPSIRQARDARDWSQNKLASKLEEAAKRHGEPLAPRASIISKISSWENNRGTPGDLHRRMLNATLGMRQVPALESDAYRKLLVLPDVDGRFQAASLQERLHKAASLTTDEQGRLVQATGELRELDRHGNAPETIATMRWHVEALHRLFEDSSKPTERLVLVKTLADAEAIAGWAALDRGLPEESLARFTRAEQAAAVGGDISLQIFASAQRSYVLIDQGACRQAEDLAHHLLKVHQRSLPPRLVVWMFGTLAEAAAAAGDAKLCKESLDKGRNLLAAKEPDDEYPFVVLDDPHFDRWAGSCLAKLGDPGASDIIARARSQIHPGFERALAGLLVDHMQAHVAQGDLEAAASLIDIAVDTAGAAGSVRQLNRLRTLQSQLASQIPSLAS